MIPLDWIAADWGSSRLRLWAVGADGELLAPAQSPVGAGALAADGFEPVLQPLAGDWMLDPGAVTVVACGMAGAREGWLVAGYRGVACPPIAPPMPGAPSRGPRLSVWIVPGLLQRTPSADV